MIYRKSVLDIKDVIQLLNCTHEVEWTPFQTHYFSENLVAPEIEPGPLYL
jgi:hypothetical protein